MTCAVDVGFVAWRFQEYQEPRDLILSDFIMIWSSRSSEYQWISVNPVIISHRIHGAGIYTNIKGVFLDGIHGAPYIAAPAGSVMGLVDQTQNISVFSGAAVSYMGCTAQFFFSETKRGQMDRLFLYSESWWKLMADGGFFSYFFKAFGVIIHIYHIYIYIIYIIYIYISSTVGWSLLGWIFTHYQSLILSFWDFLRFSEELERNTMTKAAAGRFCHLLSRKAVGKPLWHVTCEENAEALRIVRQELAQVKKETWNKKTRRKQLRG